MDKIYVIECRTGCSCCSNENHYRGPYKTKEDAERRIAYFKSPESKYWPLASQYSRRGNYSIEETTCEPISGDRYIINGDRVMYGLEFVEVNSDGTVANNDAERFDTLEA